MRKSRFKKIYIFYAIIGVGIFFLGVFLGWVFLPKNTAQKVEENCRKFCEFIPNTEFYRVDSNNHCFCSQTNQIFDSKTNKTMTYTQIVDAGIITNVEIR